MTSAGSNIHPPHVSGAHGVYTSPTGCVDLAGPLAEDWWSARTRVLGTSRPENGRTSFITVSKVNSLESGDQIRPEWRHLRL